MHKAFEILKNQRQKNSSPILADIENYLKTGDKATLKKIQLGNWTYHSTLWQCESALIASLEISVSMGETDKRLLDSLIKCNRSVNIAQTMFRKEKSDENFFPIFFEAHRNCGESESKIIEGFLDGVPPGNVDGKANSIARHILSFSDDKIRKIAEGIKGEFPLYRLAEMLAENEPDRIDVLLESLIHNMKASKRERFNMRSAEVILKKTGKEYVRRIFEAWNQIEWEYLKFLAGAELMKYAPDLFTEPTEQAARAYMIKPETKPAMWIFEFLIEHFGLEYSEMICRYLREEKRWYWEETLECVLKTFGSKSLPFFLATLKNEMSYARIVALRIMISSGTEDFGSLIEDNLRKELIGNDETLQFLLLAKRWNPSKFEAEFWKLLGNKSKPVREAAARALGEIGDINLDRVGKLLVDKKADNRDSAVNILAQLKTDKAIKLLESRLDDEENDDIRDKMLTALESAWEAKGKKITMKTVEQRIDQTAAKIEKFAAKWLDFKKLPPLHAAKKKLDEKTVRYLFYRQSRCKEMRADVEAKPLLAMIDRKTSGDFALFVLNAFLASKMDAADRWALALSGLLGDDRIVPILSKQIQVWADSARGKMSEYAVQTLALLGTETALTVVNAMTIRYRSKYKNIGTAAAIAFEQVAEERGITADELGDNVVPKLGFEFGKQRIWSIKGREFDIRLGMDFKVEIFDIEKRKTVASLPKIEKTEGHSAEFLKEIKESLKEVVKGQLLRIENMLVRQYRWPIDRWTELYLKHPVLRPFTVRLVWGLYDDKGKLKTTFRALEDGSLTDAEDETVTLPKNGKIGIVHPLELTEKQRNAWRQHLLDFEIVQPFPQLERSVIVPSVEEKNETVSKKWFGMQLNAMTFKGRAEKLGWRRGSVTDGGGISMYWKPFPEAGADAFLQLDYFFVGISMDETTTLQNLCFVKSGSVQIGSYIYDDPNMDGNDARIISFGKVPPIVFSEVMGDMRKIAPDQKES